MGPKDIDRFLGKFEQGEGCWLWKSTPRYGSTRGYGHFGYQGRSFPAHRVSYEYFVGPIPEGLEIDHLCENPRCVNPAHLEPVQRWVNQLRGCGKDRPATAYDRGNPFHPRPKDIWGRQWRNRWVRVEICKPTPGSATITFRYTTGENRRTVDLGWFLAEWKLLSRWPGLDPYGN